MTNWFDYNLNLKKYCFRLQELASAGFYLGYEAYIIIIK